jgi:hypothetical protein
MPLDLETDITLLEEDGRIVAAQHRVAQPRLEPVPARRQRARHVAHVLVVHEQHGAEAGLLHARACTLEAIAAHPVPVDALLPVQTHHAEICGHFFSVSG